MKRFVCVMVAVLALLGCMTAAFASQKQDEAKGLVKKAVTFLKKNGNEKSFAEFNKSSGQFSKGELYIFVFDSKGETVAHGGNQKLIGKNMHDLKDSDGKFFVQDILKTAKQGGGWTEYKWTNPASKKIEAKSTYVEAAGDLAVGCGFYK
jgi:cytochrome c